MNVFPWFQNRAVEAALQTITSTDRETRVKAARELATAHDHRAIDALILALDDQDTVVRDGIVVYPVAEAAEQSLQRMGGSPRDAVRGDVNVRLLQLLCNKAHPGSWPARLEAASILGYIGAYDAVLPLTAVLNDPDQAMRGQVIHALATIGKPATESLTTAMQHDDPVTRAGAREALAIMRGRAGSTTGAPPLPSLPAAANKRVVQRWYADYVNQHDLAVLDELVTHNFVNHVPSSAPGTGRSEIKQADTVLFAAFPDLHLTIKTIVAEGDTVAVRFASEGTHKGPFLGVAATGKKVTGSAMDVFRFVDGKIAERWLEGDFRGFAQQVGASSTADKAR